MAQPNGTSTSSARFDSTSTIPLWIDGKEVTTSTTFPITSPLTDKHLYNSSAASESDALAAVSAAEKAFPGWSKTLPSQRRDLFLAAAAELQRRKDELWHLCNTEVASTPTYFAFDFADAMETLTSCAGLIAPTMQGDVPTLQDEGRSAMVIREPFGVVVAIAPWNCPCILGLRAFLGPLAMGNTVVLKGPERAPACFWTLVDIFRAVGLPPGCLNTIIHRPQDGPIITSTLISAPAVKKINFTGSTAVGSIVAGLAGKNLKPVLMELGGKAPAIICEDADLELAAVQCTLGAFLFSGQICMATERILVHPSIAEPFRAILKATVDQVFPSNDGLVLIDKAPVIRNKRLLTDALSKGATSLYGTAVQDLTLSTAMRPVILENVKTNMDIYHSESFGPTVSLFVLQQCTSSDDFDREAIRIANDTDYGLASAVFTSNLQRGLRIARQIETGAVHINSMSVHDEASLPHGGAKKSGFGRFHGMEGLREWVRLKSITWKN